MLNKSRENWPVKILLEAMILLGMLGIANSAKADIETLFSTPRERQIIDVNRYKTEEIARPRIIDVSPTETTEAGEREETKKSFVISGITISNSGPHSVWINNQVYEDGALLEDNSLIKVLTDNSIRVRITTPDGKNYYGTSGEVVDVSYMASVQN